MLSLERWHGLPPAGAGPGALCCARGVTAWVAGAGAAVGGAAPRPLPAASIGPHSSVSLSPDGTLVAAASSAPGGGVALWALGPPARLICAEVGSGGGGGGGGGGGACGGGGVAALAFSGDGRWLVAVGVPGERALWLWRVRSSGLALAATGRTSQRVRAVAWGGGGGGPGSSFLVTAGERHLKFWPLPAGLEAGAVLTLASAPGIMSEAGAAFSVFVDVVCASASGREHVFALSSEGIVCCFDGATRTLEKWVDAAGENGGHAAALALHVTAAALYVASASGAVAVLGLASLERQGELAAPVPADAAVAVHAHGRRSGADAAAVLHAGGALVEWRVPRGGGGGVRRRELHAHVGAVLALAPLPPAPAPAPAGTPPLGSWVTLGADGTLRVWAPGLAAGQSSSQQISALSMGAAGPAAAPRCLAVCCMGWHAAVGDAAGHLRVFDLRAAEAVPVLDAPDLCAGGNAGGLACVAYAPASSGGSTLLAAAGGDGRLRVFMRRGMTYSAASAAADLGAAATALCFTTCGRKLVTATADGALVYWRAPAAGGGDDAALVRLRVARAPGTAPPLRSLAAEATGQALYSTGDRAGARTQVQVWSVRTGRTARVLDTGGRAAARCVATDAAGLFAAVLCDGGDVTLLDVYAGTVICRLSTGHSAAADVAFLADCRGLVTAALDGIIAVWRLAPQLTAAMLERLRELGEREAERHTAAARLPPRGHSCGGSNGSGHSAAVSDAASGGAALSPEPALNSASTIAPATAALAHMALQQSSARAELVIAPMAPRSPALSSGTSGSGVPPPLLPPPPPPSALSPPPLAAGADEAAPGAESPPPLVSVDETALAAPPLPSSPLAAAGDALAAVALPSAAATSTDGTSAHAGDAIDFRRSILPTWVRGGWLGAGVQKGGDDGGGDGAAGSGTGATDALPLVEVEPPAAAALASPPLAAAAEPPASPPIPSAAALRSSPLPATTKVINGGTGSRGAAGAKARKGCAATGAAAGGVAVGDAGSGVGAGAGAGAKLSATKKKRRHHNHRRTSKVAPPPLPLLATQPSRTPDAAAAAEPAAKASGGGATPASAAAAPSSVGAAAIPDADAELKRAQALERAQRAAAAEAVAVTSVLRAATAPSAPQPLPLLAMPSETDVAAAARDLERAGERAAELLEQLAGGHHHELATSLQQAARMVVQRLARVLPGDDEAAR